MHTASLRTDHFNDVLIRLPPGLDLDALAFETGAIQRRREISDGASLLRLALARGRVVSHSAKLRPGPR